MSNYALFILIFIGAVLVSSVSQVMLKTSANKKHQGFAKEYLNPLVIIAYLLFFGSTLITVYALKYVPLSLAPMLEAMGYVFVAILGYSILKEKISKRKIVGLLLIVVGVIICSVGTLPL